MSIYTYKGRFCLLDNFAWISSYELMVITSENIKKTTWDFVLEVKPICDKFFLKGK